MFFTTFSKPQNIVQTMHLTMLIAHPYSKRLSFVRPSVASNLVGAMVTWEPISTSGQLTQVARRGFELAVGLKAVPGQPATVGGFAANLTFKSIPIVSETFFKNGKGIYRLLLSCTNMYVNDGVSIGTSQN